MVVAWVKSPLRGSYTEGGSITHDGIKYNADAVFAIAENKPVYREHVKNLEWVLEYDTPDPARVAKADTSVPVIVALSKNGRPTVIDGLHRLAKAKTAGTEKLPVKFIERSELQRALPVGNAYSEKNLERLFDYDISLALEQDASSSGAQIIALTTKNKQLAELSNVVPTAYKKRLYDEIAAATFNDPEFRKLNERLGLTEKDLRGSGQRTRSQLFVADAGT